MGKHSKGRGPDSAAGGRSHRSSVDPQSYREHAGEILDCPICNPSRGSEGAGHAGGKAGKAPLRAPGRYQVVYGADGGGSPVPEEPGELPPSTDAAASPVETSLDDDYPDEITEVTRARLELALTGEKLKQMCEEYTASIIPPPKKGPP